MSKKNILFIALFSLLAMLLVMTQTQASEVSTLLKTVDSDGDVGQHTSVAMTSTDAPVISYYDVDNADLKVAICDSPQCENPDVETLDSDGITGIYTSIALGINERPLISYYDRSAGDLNLAICDDWNCSGSNIVPVDQAGHVGQFTSMVLNEDGYPVISYYDVDNSALKIAVCDDLSCANPTIETVDSAGNVGQYNSLQLNSDGFPVISYYDAEPNKDLKIAFCDDATCSNPTIETLVQVGDVGKHSSLLLRDGLPYVAFIEEDGPFHFLNIAACFDPICAAGTDGTIELEKLTGEYVSLGVNQLDQLTLSYWNDSNDELRVMVCPTVDIGLCFSSLTYRLDRVNNPGSHAAMAFNSAGEPVISYYSIDNQELRLATCPLCRMPEREHFDDAIPTEDTVALALSPDDRPYLTYYNFAEGKFNLVICVDMACSSSTVTPLENGLMVQPDMVMQKDNGFPLITYHHLADDSLKIIVCNNRECTDRNFNTIAAMGKEPSMQLNSSGLPMISYYDANNQDLVLAYCNDLLCTLPHKKIIADIGTTGRHSSLVLRSDDTPAISYYDESNLMIKLVLCSNANCSVVHDKAGKPDSGPYNALGLRNDSTLITFYYDSAAGELWQMACSFPDCTGITTFSLVDDAGGDVGLEVALAMSESGLPLLAYHDAIGKDLEFAICGRTTCKNATMTTLDRFGVEVGRYPALALNSNGYPVVANIHISSTTLRLDIYQPQPPPPEEPTIFLPVIVQ